MRKVFVLAALSLLLFNVGSVFADPFLVCDPQTDANKFRIQLSADNGSTWGNWVEGPPVSNAMRFDLSGTGAGTYQGRAQAGALVSVTDSTSGQTTNSQQWSASSPFVLRSSLPAVPKNTKVVDGN
jgi:hypothetical protein